MKRLTLKFIDNINKTEGKLHYQEEYFDLMNIIDLERLNQKVKQNSYIANGFTICSSNFVSNFDYQKEVIKKKELKESIQNEFHPILTCIVGEEKDNSVHFMGDIFAKTNYTVTVSNPLVINEYLKEIIDNIIIGDMEKSKEIIENMIHKKNEEKKLQKIC